MNTIKKVFLIGMIFSSLLFSTVIEDAEDGTTSGWIASSGATVSNVTDDETESKVIKLSSSSYKYYKIKSLDDSATTIKWDIKANSGFIVYIFATTTEGNRLFYYTISSRDKGVTGSGIHHGLNQEVTDGTWHTIERDLEAELQESEPDNSILKITSFKIRSTGDVFVDNIETDGSSPTSTPTPISTVIEDAEDGRTNGWIVSSGATVSNVTDDETESKVIKLSSSSYKYYRMSGLNSVSTKIKWDIKANSGFIVYVHTVTTQGNRLFYYTKLNRDKGVTSSGIHHGLGESIADGEWHTITRDLEAELQEFEPDNSIMKITSFKIRSIGDVFMDNITGWNGTLTPLPPTLTTDVPIEPRYTRDDDKEIVEDHITGLIWQDNTEAKSTSMPWAHSEYTCSCFCYCDELKLGGYVDWRVPTVVELQGIAVNVKAYTTVFLNYSTYGYSWSSSSSSVYDAWFVDVFGDGYTNQSSKSYSHHIRCVRAGQ